MDSLQQRQLNDRIRNEAGDKDCIHGIKLKDCNRCFTKIANDLDSGKDVSRTIKAAIA